MPLPLAPPVRRTLAGSGLGLLIAVAVALPAAAHVTVNSAEAEQGGYAKLTFRVPTERADASTTRLVVQLPQATPFRSVSVKPHAGWSAEVTEATLTPPIVTAEGTTTRAASTVTWTATSRAARIAPGEFDEFELSVGPLPATDSLTFKALQTYSDGETVRWIEPTSGGAEPDRPAPTLVLTTKAAPLATAPVASTVPSTGVFAVAVVGLAVGMIGLGVAVFALRAAGRPVAPTVVTGPVHDEMTPVPG